jgi:preprotein translocase subunit Sec61beta
MQLRLVQEAHQLQTLRDRKATLHLLRLLFFLPEAAAAGEPEMEPRVVLAAAAALALLLEQAALEFLGKDLMVEMD